MDPGIQKKFTGWPHHHDHACAPNFFFLLLFIIKVKRQDFTDERRTPRRGERLGYDNNFLCQVTGLASVVLHNRGRQKPVRNLGWPTPRFSLSPPPPPPTVTPTLTLLTYIIYTCANTPISKP